ncbi:hypothetical protein Kim5_PD00235 (plasmid) [Rhizobium sp. Kim5]|nr:hypothetical protein Kim5_PD00235 [Rhizobium sp. Kim5]
MKASRTSGSPNFASAPVPSASPKSAPPLAGSAGRVPRSLTPPSRHDRGRRFHNVKETTMTICIDEVIELLRAELGNADPAERRQIESELELALAEREIIEAEQDGRIDAEPPF